MQAIMADLKDVQVQVIIGGIRWMTRKYCHEGAFKVFNG